MTEGAATGPQEAAAAANDSASAWRAKEVVKLRIRYREDQALSNNGPLSAHARRNTSGRRPVMIHGMGASMLALLLALAANGAGASGAAPAGAAAAAAGGPPAAHAPPLGDHTQERGGLLVGSAHCVLPLGEAGPGPEPQARFRLDGVD